MSHNLTSRLRNLPGRLAHAPLRLKVMAGVVAVTLAALAAFDVGVVTTMHRYLLTQTDNNLHLALTQTEPRLSSLLSEGVPARETVIVNRPLLDASHQKRGHGRSQQERKLSIHVLPKRSRPVHRLWEERLAHPEKQIYGGGADGKVKEQVPGCAKPLPALGAFAPARCLGKAGLEVGTRLRGAGFFSRRWGHWVDHHRHQQNRAPSW